MAFSQNGDKKVKPHKLSKEDAAIMTPEQRMSYENNRKTKGGKKKMSTRQKVHTQKKQARAAEHTKVPKARGKSKPKKV
ncbi:hypothetical protein WSM22_10710 [Cytophagales bacterium WSM2-2]|nr:hypothetical protein WSM22_10710 [Cytophagales bacterium WSM2-2]